MDEAQHAALRALIDPILADQDIELVELTCQPQGWQQLVRLLVDRPGGVTLQQCAQLNQLIGQTLDAANAVEGSYTVEVSSPGLDRPLVTPRDFERAVGDELLVVLDAGDGRIKELRGMVVAVQDAAVAMKTTSGHVTIPLADIRRAKKVLRW